MFVHLFPAQWLTVISALGDDLPQVQARVSAACNDAGMYDVVAVEGQTAGWLAVAERLDNHEQTKDVAGMIRMLATAAETR